jgi:hypothetical protein
LPQRKLDAKDGACVIGTRQNQGAAVRGDDFLCDAEAKPRAPLPPGRERLKQVFPQGGWKTRPIVTYVDPDDAVEGLGLEANSPRPRLGGVNARLLKARNSCVWSA